MPRRAFALLALALLLPPPAARAAASIWPASPGYMLISNAIGNNWARTDAVIPDGLGGGFVGWSEFGANIRVQHKLVSGLTATGWVNVGSVACPSSVGGTRDYVALAPDAGQGVYVAWVDGRPGDISDIYLQHLVDDGTVAPGWPSGGVRVTSVASTYDYYPQLLSDGVGGVYVCWVENNQTLNTYFQRVTRLTSAGTFVAGWSTNGVALHTSGNSAYPASLASDSKEGVIAAFTIGAQLRVQRIRADATQDAAHWPADGTIISNNAVYSSFVGPTLVSRVSGEIFLAWSDTRFGSSDEYLLRLTPNGISAGWPSTGLAVASTGGSETEIAATPDGTGGALVAWLDNTGTNCVARRVLSNGTFDPAWPAGGRVLMPLFYTSPGADKVSVAPAASGGMVVIVSRYNVPLGKFDLIATRVRANGTIPAEWAAGPTMMYQSNNYHPTVRAVPDGNDGAIAFFLPYSGGYYSEAAQRVRWDGTLGMVSAPRLTAVRDVGPDQGGQVRVFCNASEGDTLPNTSVASYRLWRQVTAAAAQAKIARGAKVTSPETAGDASLGALLQMAGGASLGALRQARAANGTQLYWEYITSWPSRAVAAYSQLVSTASDSMPGSIPWETFIIDAMTPGGAIHATSFADSGYSVDNLSPPAPAPFVAAYSFGATHLHWGPSAEADYHHFALYKGSDASFVPGPGSLIASPSDTGYADPGAAGSYYKLAAVDVHGNIGAFAMVTPFTTTDVVGGDLALEFARPSPNPARGEALLRFTLPHAGVVELALFDVSGRRARMIVRDTRPAGSFAERWDGTDGNGRAMPNGVYLARLTFAGRTLVQRLSLIR
jgi:hypothetical protein